MKRKRGIKLDKKGSVSKRVTFRVTVNPDSEVYLAGSFNNWDTQRHKMKDTRHNGKHTITLMLHRGEYEYKYVVNGHWVVDPECQDWVRNSLGTLNSVKRVD